VKADLLNVAGRVQGAGRRGDLRHPRIQTSAATRESCRSATITFDCPGRSLICHKRQSASGL
jgi:hypothetical protein